MERETSARITAQIGELIAAVFDVAAGCSADPREVSRMATSTIMHIMRRAQVPSPPPLLPVLFAEEGVAGGCASLRV